MHSIPPRPEPTYTSPSQQRQAPRGPGAVYFGLALSLTAVSTATSSDLLERVTLQPVSVRTPRDTNTTSLQQRVAVMPSKPSWLETTIDELLAQIPVDAWDKVPERHVADIDKRM